MLHSNQLMTVCRGFSCTVVGAIGQKGRIGQFVSLFVCFLYFVFCYILLCLTMFRSIGSQSMIGLSLAF